jgi:hypothetical protein
LRVDGDAVAPQCQPGETDHRRQLDPA